LAGALALVGAFAGVFGAAGALGFAAAFGFAGAFFTGATIDEASVPAGSASTTNGIGVVAAGSGTLYGAVTLFGATGATSSDFLSLRMKKNQAIPAKITNPIRPKPL
jgi:hypothetical protein